VDIKCNSFDNTCDLGLLLIFGIKVKFYFDIESRYLLIEKNKGLSLKKKKG